MKITQLLLWVAVILLSVFYLNLHNTVNGLRAGIIASTQVSDNNKLEPQVKDIESRLSSIETKLKLQSYDRIGDPSSNDFINLKTQVGILEIDVKNLKNKLNSF